MVEPMMLVAKQALSAAVTDALRRVQDARAEQAYSDLMEELRLENITPESAAADDATAARMVSFFFAMSQGAARQNLRVLAQIIAKRAVYPLKSEDDFMSWAAILGGLRREEVIVLGAFHRHQSNCLAGFDEDLLDPNGDDKGRHAAMLRANKEVVDELVGSTKPFKKELAYLATATALSRTGLLIEYPVLDSKHFQTTALMRELAKMIRLDEWAQDAMAL